MRSEIVRIYKLVHTWTGLLAGMALFIAFYAGAITLFKEPLVRWASPPASVAERTVSLEEVPALVTALIAAHPEAARDLRVGLTPAPPRERVEWEVHPPGADEHDSLSARHFRAVFDDGGAVRADEVRRTHVAELIDVLHRVVGLPVDRDECRWFMGVVAALYAVAIFSGVVIVLPSLVKDLFALRVGPNLKRMWLDVHNVVGIFSLPFHVIMAVTAVVFAFHDGIYFVQDRVLYGGKLSATFQGRPPPDATPRDPAKMLPPAEIVSKVTAIAPDFEPEALQYLQVTSPRASVRVWGHSSKALGFRAFGSFAMVDPYSGKLMTTEYLPGHQSGAATVLTSAFALHFGSYGGAPLKGVYFLLALLGAWLFYTGNLLWVETRRRKAKQRAGGEIPSQRRDTRLMAAATVGVCLGSVCGISCTIAAAKWLPGHVADPNAWHKYVYYAVFFGGVAWSFARGPARAAIDLLRFAAASTLAIPVTTLLGAALPWLGPWAHPAALGVDATALAMAIGYAWMARATSRRARSGPADSVWSLEAPAASPSA